MDDASKRQSVFAFMLRTLEYSEMLWHVRVEQGESLTVADLREKDTAYLHDQAYVRALNRWAQSHRLQVVTVGEGGLEVVLNSRVQLVTSFGLQPATVIGAAQAMAAHNMRKPIIGASTSLMSEYCGV